MRSIAKRFIEALRIEAAAIVLTWIVVLALIIPIIALCDSCSIREQSKRDGCAYESFHLISLVCTLVAHVATDYVAR